MPQYKELDTLRTFKVKLNTALSDTLSVLKDLLVQNKLVGEMAAKNILSPTGSSDYTKASQLMSAVYSYVQTVSSQEKATLIFNTLVRDVLYNDTLGLEDLAQQLVKHRGTLCVNVEDIDAFDMQIESISYSLNFHAIIIQCR